MTLEATAIDPAQSVPDRAMPRRSASNVVAPLVPVLVWAVVVGRWFTGALRGGQYDDAFITYRYAANLADGHGLVFNVGERTNSASSLLYTLALAAARLVGIENLPRIGAAVGVATAIVLLVVLEVTLRRITGTALWSVPIVSAFALAAPFAYWSVSGMETVPYAALLVVFAWAYLFRPRAWLLAVVLTAVVLTRPEGFLIVVAVVPREVVLAWSAREWRRPAWLVAPIGAIAAVFMFWRIYYGAFTSDAVRFKELGRYYLSTPGAQWDAVRSFFTHGYPLVVVMLIAALVGMACRAFKDPTTLLGPEVTLLLIAVAMLVSLLFGPTSDFDRYTLPLVPLVVIVAGYAIPYAFVPVARASRWTVVPIGIAVLVALLVVSFRHGNDSNLGLHQQAAFDEKLQADRRHVGELIEERGAPGTEVLSSDLGGISYYAPSHPFIDALGLTDPGALAAVQRDPRCLSAYVEAQRPRYLADTMIGHAAPNSVVVLDRPASVLDVPDRIPDPTFGGRATRTQLTAGPRRHAYETVFRAMLFELDWRSGYVVPERCAGVA